MRVLGALVVGLIMYVGVPMLWQHLMVAKIQEISANPANFPVGNAAVTNFAFDGNVINAVNPTVTINTEEFERIGAQATADQQMRQIRAAQDQAWAASHQNIP